MNALSNFFEVLARLSLQAVTKTEIAILSLVMVSVCFAEKFCFIEHGEVQASQFVLLQRMYVGLEWRAQLSFSESWQAALQWCILRYLMSLKATLKNKMICLPSSKHVTTFQTSALQTFQTSA